MCSVSNAGCCVLPDGSTDPAKGKPTSSFYRHKEGWCTSTGGQKSSSSPRIRGVQWMSTVESTLCGTEEHGAGRGSYPRRRPDLAEIAPASLDRRLGFFESFPFLWIGGRL